MMMMMMSLPNMKMKIYCLQPQLPLSSSRLLAETRPIRSRPSYLVQSGSARRKRLTTKSIKSLEKAHPFDLEKKQWRRYALVSGVSVGLMMALVMGMDAEKAMALGPEAPLMEESWDNVRRYGLNALTVCTGALSAAFEPIFEFLKNPISAVLILIILGGSFYIVSQVVSSMVGANEFVYDYGY